MGLRISAGKLDVPCVFERVTLTQDAYGGEIEAWAAIAKSPTMAQYMPLRGAEAIETQKRTSKTVFKLRIRRHAGLKPMDRVTANGMVADIVSIEDNIRSGDMVVWAEVRE